MWMIDDGLAFRLTPAGWVAIALSRAAEGIAGAVIIGLPLAVANRVVFAHLFPHREPVRWLVAATPGWLIALGSLLGSIQFLIQKPYM